MLVGELGDQETVAFQEIYFKGQQAKLTGNNDKAFALFQQASELNPENDAIWFEMGRMQQALGNDLLALDYAQKATALDENNEWYHAFEAELYSTMGRNDAMESSLLSVIKINDQRREAYQNLLEVQMRLGAPKRALETLDKMAAALGPHSDIYLNRFRIHSLDADPEAANKDLEDLMAAFPADPRNQLITLDHYLNSGQTDKADALYADLQAAGLAAPELQLRMSIALMDRGNMAEALAAQKTAFASAEVAFEAKLEVALVYFQTSAVDPSMVGPALELITLLQETHPNESQSHALVGDWHARAGEVASARDAYEKALALDPSQDLLWQQLLSLDLNLNDMAALALHSGQAMELFPVQPEYYLYNGMAKVNLGQAKEAIVSLDGGRLLVLDNPDLMAQFWSQLGDAHHQAGQHTESDQAYQKSLAIDGENVFVLNNYAYYLSLRGEDLARAENMSQTCNTLEPNQPSFMDTLGWIYFQQAKYDKAIEWLTKANVATGGTSGEILEHLGDAEFKNGQPDKALELWKAAVETGAASKTLLQKIESGSLDE